MAAKGRGGGITPINVVNLVNKAVSEKSLRAVSKETGLGLAALSRYSQGIGEPSTVTLVKLADYFRVSVAYLRGENRFDLLFFVEKTKDIAVVINEVIHNSSARTEGNLWGVLAQVQLLTVYALDYERSERSIRGESTELLSESIERLREDIERVIASAHDSMGRANLEFLPAKKI